MWLDASEATHALVPLDPSSPVTENLNKMVMQFEEDRRHMLVLKGAIERLHENQEQQGRTLASTRRGGTSREP